MDKIILVKPDHWTSETQAMLLLMEQCALFIHKDNDEQVEEIRIAFERMTDLITYAVLHDLPDPLAAFVAACEYVDFSKCYHVDLGGNDNEGNEENHVQDR